MLNLPHIFILSPNLHCLDSFLMTKTFFSYIRPTLVTVLSSSIILIAYTYCPHCHYHFFFFRRKYYYRVQIYFSDTLPENIFWGLKVFLVIACIQLILGCWMIYVSRGQVPFTTKGKPLCSRSMRFPNFTSGTLSSTETPQGLPWEINRVTPTVKDTCEKKTDNPLNI